MHRSAVPVTKMLDRKRRYEADASAKKKQYQRMKALSAYKRLAKREGLNKSEESKNTEDDPAHLADAESIDEFQSEQSPPPRKRARLDQSNHSKAHEAKLAAEQRQAERVAHHRQVEESRKKRQQQAQLLKTRTKKNQPVMRYQVEHLLSKLQQQR